MYIFHVLVPLFHFFPFFPLFKSEKKGTSLVMSHHLSLSLSLSKNTKNK